LDDFIIEDLHRQGAIRRTSEYENKFDLHDICRVVRNLVYQMNEHPKKLYTVYPQHYSGSSTILGTETPVFSLLSFSGDYTHIDPSRMLKVMEDFAICFERVGLYQFVLRREYAVWPPNPEDTEGNQNRRANRGSHQAFRPPGRARQSGRFQRSSNYQR